MAKTVLGQIKTDCYMGEKILLCNPMNLFIASNINEDHSMDFYKVMNVILTNHGVYIVDDHE